MINAVLKERFLIIANGPFRELEQIKALSEGRMTIALDGAATRLNKLHFIPDVILGDFDSIKDKKYWGIKEESLKMKFPNSYIGNFGNLIVSVSDQKYTDLEKAILFCDQKNASDILIVNAFSHTRLDHSLGSLGLLRKYYKLERPIILLGKNQKVEFVRDNIATIQGSIGDYCAIMGYPEAIITTTGLCYNCNQYPIKLGIQESICNSLIEPTANVHIQGEALVIHPFKFKRQRS